MSLTATEKLKVKKHLGFPPTNTELDAWISTLEDGAEKENEFKAAITKCDTKLAALELAQTEADDLESGEGAVFNHGNRITIKRQAYREACGDLARILNLDLGHSSCKVIL